MDRRTRPTNTTRSTSSPGIRTAPLTLTSRSTIRWISKGSRNTISLSVSRRRSKGPFGHYLGSALWRDWKSFQRIPRLPRGYRRQTNHSAVNTEFRASQELHCSSVQLLFALWFQAIKKEMKRKNKKNLLANRPPAGELDGQFDMDPFEDCMYVIPWDLI